MAAPDLVEVLAHLDLLVEGPKTRSLQDANTEQQIRGILTEVGESLDNQYTVRQIKGRLWEEFRHGFMYPEDNFPLLFLHGSSEIHTLNPITVERIKERLDVLRLEKEQKTPRTRRWRSIPPAPTIASKRTVKNTSTLARPCASSNPGKRHMKRINKNDTCKKNTSIKVYIFPNYSESATDLNHRLDIVQSPRLETEQHKP